MILKKKIAITIMMCERWAGQSPLATIIINLDIARAKAAEFILEIKRFAEL